MRRRITRREAFRALAASTAGLGLARSAPGSLARRSPGSPKRPPNIVVFLTDDQRADAMSAAGNPILKTPNMDRIAASGVRFSEMFVTNALCAPSRASFLTGLYSHAHGVITNGDGPDFVDQKGIEGQKTFVHRLRSAGYYTGLVGKWHILSAPEGFDQYVMLPGQGQYFDPDVIANGVVVKTRGHVEDVIGDQALTFLRGAPKDHPLLLLCWFKAPHRSWEPAPRFAKIFEDVEVPAPRTFEDRLEGRPEALRRAAMALADMGDFAERGVPKTLPVEERKRRNLQALVKNYYRTLLGVDENVGRVLDELEKRDLAARTAVFYTSDNGFFLGEHGLFDKRLMYEPSIRVPMLARFPPRFPAGRVDARHLVLNVDLAPTLLKLAGAPVPEGLHGRSFLPLAEGRDAPWRQDFLYEYYEYPGPHCVRKNRGVRTDRWKLIHFWEQPEEWELYDLASDPDETSNLAGRSEQARRVAELRARLDQLRRELGDSDPPGPPGMAVACTSGIGG